MPFSMVAFLCDLCYFQLDILIKHKLLCEDENQVHIHKILHICGITNNQEKELLSTERNLYFR